MNSSQSQSPKLEALQLEHSIYAVLYKAAFGIRWRASDKYESAMVKVEQDTFALDPCACALMHQARVTLRCQLHLQLVRAKEQVRL
ncbi:MAG: hypothetical protein HYR88_17935 [Verrucomicrobia bacterium]|nr:hypothetical protein [Verrucomicrobiota bacterium]MBI3868809.1 hypothetical protein [Verrucomicrobiota bacterium]